MVARGVDHPPTEVPAPDLDAVSENVGFPPQRPDGGDRGEAAIRLLELGVGDAGDARPALGRGPQGPDDREEVRRVSQIHGPLGRMQSPSITPDEGGPVLPLAYLGPHPGQQVEEAPVRLCRPARHPSDLDRPTPERRGGPPRRGRGGVALDLVAGATGGSRRHVDPPAGAVEPLGLGGDAERAEDIHRQPEVGPGDRLVEQVEFQPPDPRGDEHQGRGELAALPRLDGQDATAATRASSIPSFSP